MLRLTGTRNEVAAEVAPKWDPALMITVEWSMVTTGWCRTMVEPCLTQAMAPDTPPPTILITLKVETPGCDATFRHVI